MNRSKHKTSNASVDKSFKEKSFRVVSNKYSKHNVSQSQMLIRVAAYQRKIKALLKVNKTLARALQDLRHDSAVKNNVIMAYTKDSNHIMLAQEKLKNMGISLKMLVGNLSEALEFLSGVKCIREKIHLSSGNDCFQKISQEPDLSCVAEEESIAELSMEQDEEKTNTRTSTKPEQFSLPKSDVPSNKLEAPQSKNNLLGTTTLQEDVLAFCQTATSHADGSWTTTSHGSDSTASHTTTFQDDDEQAITCAKTSRRKSVNAIQNINKPPTRKSLPRSNKPAVSRSSLGTSRKSTASQNVSKYVEEQDLSKLPATSQSSAMGNNNHPATMSQPYQQAVSSMPEEPEAQKMEVVSVETQNKIAMSKFDEMTEVYDVQRILNAATSHKADFQSSETARDDEMTEMYDIRPFTNERKHKEPQDMEQYKKREECCTNESPATPQLNLAQVDSLTPEPPAQENPILPKGSLLFESPGTPRLVLLHRYSQSTELIAQTDPVRPTESPTTKSKIPQKVPQNVPFSEALTAGPEKKQVTEKPNRRETFVIPQIPNVSSFTSRGTFVVKDRPKELPRQDDVHVDKRLTYFVPVPPVETKQPKSEVHASPKTLQTKRLTYVVPMSPVLNAKTKMPESPKRSLRNERKSKLTDFRDTPELPAAFELPKQTVPIPKDMEPTPGFKVPTIMGGNSVNAIKTSVPPKAPEVANLERPAASELPNQTVLIPEDMELTTVINVPIIMGDNSANAFKSSAASKVPEETNLEVPIMKKPLTADKTPKSSIPIKEVRNNPDVLATKPICLGPPVIPIEDKSNRRKTMKRVSFIPPRESLCKESVKKQQIKDVETDSEDEVGPSTKNKRSSRPQKSVMRFYFSSSDSNISLSLSDSEYLPEASEFPKPKKIPSRRSLHPGTKKSFVFTTKNKKNIPGSSLENDESHSLNPYSYDESPKETKCNNRDTKKSHKKSKKHKSTNEDLDSHKKSKKTYNDKLQSLCQVAKQKKSSKTRDRISESSSEQEKISNKPSTSSADGLKTSIKPSNYDQCKPFENCLHSELSNRDPISENFIQNVDSFTEQQDEESEPSPGFIKSKAERKTISNKRQSSISGSSETSDKGTRKREFSGVSERRSKKRATAEMNLPGSEELNLHGKNSSVLSLPVSKYSVGDSLDDMLDSFLLDKSDLEYSDSEKPKNVSSVKRLTSSKRKSLAVGKKSIQRSPGLSRGLISSNRESKVFSKASVSSAVQKQSSDTNDVLESAGSGELMSSTKKAANKKKTKHVIKMKSIGVLGQRESDLSCEGNSRNTLASKDSLSQVFGETPAKTKLLDSRVSKENIIPSEERTRRPRDAVKSYKEPSLNTKMRREK